MLAGGERGCRIRTANTAVAGRTRLFQPKQMCGECKIHPGFQRLVTHPKKKKKKKKRM